MAHSLVITSSIILATSLIPVGTSLLVVIVTSTLHITITDNIILLIIICIRLLCSTGFWGFGVLGF